MNFPTAVTTVFKKYVTFSGVASRSEYWWFFLFNVAVSTVLRVIGVSILISLWGLAVLLPSLAVNVRRLHDTGRSGWWWFAWIIFPWEIVLLCLATVTDGNPYVGVRAPSITEESLTHSSSRCSSCGKLRLPGQHYCQGCGAKLIEE